MVYSTHQEPMQASPRRPHQPRPNQAGQPAHHRVVDHRDRDRRAAQAAGEDGQGQPAACAATSQPMPLVWSQ
jgi:hypothetical protein